MTVSLRSSLALLATLASLPAAPAFAQFAVSSPMGPPYPIPSGPGTGGGGVWPGTLPPASAQTLIPLATPVPPGATSITDVWLEWLDHTWSGDLQFVLIDPSGARFNLVHRPNLMNAGAFGQACDYAGDYVVIDRLGVPNQLWSPTSAACVAALPQGSYTQYYEPFAGAAGAWPSGVNGIFNVDLRNITPVPGIWSLLIIDWESGDVGTLYRWGMDGTTSGSAPASYCTAGTTTNGCTANMTADQNPSVTFANPCTLSVSDVEGQKNAIVFYGLSAMAAPWGLGSTSFLCVKSPSQRLAAQNSGGASGACNGTLSVNWNAFHLANPGALGAPFAAGDTVYCQAWFRDPPAPRTTNLTDAVALTWQP